MKNNSYSARTFVRWMRWIGLSYLLLAGMLNVAQAQVSVLLNPTYGYTFANSLGTYTTLSGGTVFQSGATLSTDAVSAAITLPFTFTYNGIKENTIYISNNGYITFNSAPTASVTVPLSTTTTSGYDGAIAGLANNLIAASSGSPEIRYGTNVGGDFVVQFQDLAISSYTSTRITFQIILAVDGKTVQIVYGPNNTGQASATGSQVGLRGTNHQDWNNRSLASGGNWNTAGGAAGTSNTSTMTWTASSTLPTSGRTFTWTPTAYAPTYKANAIGSTEEFNTWSNGSGPSNIPSSNWATNGYGNASWQIDNTTASTTGSGWTGTSGAYTPVDYAGVSGAHSARFHAYNASSPQVGYLDYYVNLSGCGTANRRVSFYTILTGSAPNLQVYLSTDGGTTFTLQTMSPAFGTNAAWVSRYVDLGSVTSATTIIRFKGTSDFGSNDIGLDHVSISLTGVTPPSIAVSPTSASLCAGDPGIALTGSGAGIGGTYTWSPGAGLNATTGANVTATPTSTTIYTVTGTDVNCAQGTATVSISVNAAVAASATASPANVCFGANSNLLAVGSQSFTTPLANTYAFAGSSTTYSSITGTNLGASAIGDDVGIGNLPIGFTFNYNGSNETVFAASSNGFIQLGNTSPTISGFSSNALASTAKVIAALWDDNNTTGGTITYATTGSVGARVLTVQYTAMHVGGSGSGSNPTIDFQIKLYEGSNKIEIIYGSTSGALASTTASIGISGASGNYISVTPLSPANTSTYSTSSENSSISAATNFPSGTMYTFTPSGAPTFTYAWSPPTFLSATNIANPVATGVTASTTYTVTVTGNGGCSSTATVSVNTVPLNAGTITSAGTACVGSNTITANPSGGGSPYSYSWSPGGATTQTISTTAGTITYTVTVTDACLNTATSTITVTTNALPSVTASPSTSTYCSPGSSPIAITASGASTYAWSPGAGLNATTGANVNASPVTATVYTVSGTDANGCVGTATSSIGVSAAIFAGAISATPNPVCSGGNSQLNVNAGNTTTYGVASTPYGLISGTGTAITFSSADDGNATVAMPFPFSFFGSTYSSMFVHSNGFVSFTTGQPTGSPYVETIPTSATPNNYIAICHDDLNVTGGGVVSYFTSGSSPNRVFVINWSAVKFYNTAANNGDMSGQIQLFENDMHIEVHVTSSNDPTASAHALGIENSGGTVGYAAPGRNNVTYSFTNTTPEAWTFYPTGGTLTYSWSPATDLDFTNIANPLASNLLADVTYSVTVTEASGCAATRTVTVTVGTALSVSTTASSTTVCDGQSVTLNAIPSGGGAPYSYSWDDPSSSTTASTTFVPAAGSTTDYTVTVTDACGATEKSTVTITSNALPVVSITGGSLICGSGSVTLTADGANTYSWSPGGSTANPLTVSPTSTTTYTVTGTDANSCSNTATQTVVVAPAVTVSSVTATPGSICEGSTTALSVSASIASSAYCSPATNNGGTSGDEITAFTSAGMGFAYTNAIQTPTPGYLDKTTIVGNAVAGSTYSISISQQDGSDAARVWLDANNNGSFADPGELLATSSVGTSVTFSVTIPSGAYNGNLRLRVRNVYTSSNPVANLLSCTTGLSYGVSIDFTLNVTGGIDALTYAWNPAAGLTPSASVSNPTTPALTSSTVYTVTATSAAGCTGSGTVSVTVDPTITVSMSSSDVTCNGGTNGSATVTASGGTGSYSYSWSPSGGSGATASGLAAGTYTVTVTDGICSATSTVSITEPAALVATCTLISNVNCNGGSDGAASVSASGGVGPYSGTGTFTGLAPGTYNYTVTDANFCTASCSVTITEPAAPLSIVCTPDNESAPGANDGSVNIVASGGTSLYSNDGLHSGLAAGTYSYTVTDANGCTASCTVTVGTDCIPSTPATSASASALEICSGNNVNLSLTGGSLGTGASWKWYEGGCGAGSVIGTGASITTGAIIGAGVHTFYARAEGLCGTTSCVSVSVTVTAGAPTGSIAVVSFPASGCVGGTASITCTSVPGATGYSWSGPAGILFDGNPSPYVSTSTTVTLTYTALPPSGISGWNVCVFAKNACGNSPNTKCSWIRATLSTPTYTSAPTIACPSTTVIYSVATVDGAATYNWTITGAAGINGGGASMTTAVPTINVNFGAGFSGGTLCVTATTSCGYTSGSRCVTIGTAPLLPPAISGSTTICPGSSSSYSITPVAGAVSYVWSVTGTGVSVVGSGTSATVSTTGSFVSGSVCVVAMSACGSPSAQRCKTIGTGRLGTPGNITGDPTTGVCGQTYTYSIPSVSGATGGYTWTLPSGATGSSSTNSITITFSGSFTTGSLCVHANNSCGAGPDRCVTVSGNPGTPATLTGNATPCIAFDDVYTWSAVPGATQYLLVVPAGYTVISGNPTISNFAIINIGGAAGSIGVKAQNACGVSGTRTLAITPVSCRLAGNQPEVVKALATQVFPNPTTGLLNVQFNSELNDQAYVINVLDLSGRVVLSTEGKANAGSNLQVLDLTNLAKGMYMISLQTNEGNQLVRVSVE